MTSACATWVPNIEALKVALHHCRSVYMRCSMLTLSRQVQRDFEELPENAVDSLRDSLMTLLLKYAKCVL